jgi:hypothetical protein
MKFMYPVGNPVSSTSGSGLLRHGPPSPFRLLVRGETAGPTLATGPITSRSVIATARRMGSIHKRHGHDPSRAGHFSVPVSWEPALVPPAECALQWLDAESEPGVLTLVAGQAQHLPYAWRQEDSLAEHWDYHLLTSHRLRRPTKNHRGPREKATTVRPPTSTSRCKTTQSLHPRFS